MCFVRQHSTLGQPYQLIHPLCLVLSFIIFMNRIPADDRLLVFIVNIALPEGYIISAQFVVVYILSTPSKSHDLAVDKWSLT